MFIMKRIYFTIIIIILSLFVIVGVIHLVVIDLSNSSINPKYEEVRIIYTTTTNKGDLEYRIMSMIDREGDGRIEEVIMGMGNVTGTILKPFKHLVVKGYSTIHSSTIVDTVDYIPQAYQERFVNNTFGFIERK